MDIINPQTIVAAGKGVAGYTVAKFAVQTALSSMGQEFDSNFTPVGSLLAIGPLASVIGRFGGREAAMGCAIWGFASGLAWGLKKANVGLPFGVGVTY